ncbi:MAG: glycosyltransferase, partial [Candidatus Dormibacteraeota bacterium]|nr:glycosyltransferase [Candidatus Dormibacteraeota bacterium]
MSRLLVISPAPMTGGAEGYALAIARAAGQRDWDVRMALPVTPGTEMMRAELAMAGIPAVALPCVDNYETGARPRRWRESWAVGQIAVILLRLAPDVVHLTIPWPGFGLSGQLAAALLGVPTVVVFQLVPDPVPLPDAPRIYSFMRRRRQLWVAVSEHGQRLIASAARLPTNQVEVIYNGAAIRFGGAPTLPEARQSVRAELGVPADGRLVVSVGRLHQQKGHRDLIAAFTALARRDGDLHLVIVGEGEEERALRAQADEAGVADHVHLLGSRDDVPRLLAAGDVFAFASRFEGLPFSLVEAMAGGLPVVSTAFPGAEEIIRDGRDGVLVPVGD